MDLLVLHTVLGLSLHLLAALLLVVLPLHLLELASQPLNLVLVLVDLSLVHVQFGSHSLHLVGLLLQVLLVDRKLLSNLWSWLSGQQVLELEVEFLFLLDGDILLDYLFSLLDEPLLKGLDLLDQLISVRIRSLDSPPPMVIERVLKLLRKSLHLEPLLLELVSKSANLSLVLDDLSSLTLLNLEFALQLTNLVLEKLDVFKTLSILDLSLTEGDLQDLDLLVEEGKLIVSPDKLSSEDISHILDFQVVLSLSLEHVDGLSDKKTQLGDHGLSLLELLLGEILLLNLSLELLLADFEILSFLTELLMLGHQSGLLIVNLVLKLMDLMLGNLELLSQLNDLVIGLNQVLSIQVTVRTDNLVQVLLLLELVLEVQILLLKLTNQVSLKFDFFEHLHKVGVSLVSSLNFLFLVNLELLDLLEESVDVLLVLVVLVLQGVDVVLLSDESTLVLLMLLLKIGQVGLENITVTLKLHDVGLLLISSLLDPIEVTVQRSHVCLGILLLFDGIVLLFDESLLLVLKVLHVSLKGSANPVHVLVGLLLVS